MNWRKSITGCTTTTLTLFKTDSRDVCIFCITKGTVACRPEFHCTVQMHSCLAPLVACWVVWVLYIYCINTKIKLKKLHNPCVSFIMYWFSFLLHTADVQYLCIFETMEGGWLFIKSADLWPREKWNDINISVCNFKFKC